MNTSGSICAGITAITGALVVSTGMAQQEPATEASAPELFQVEVLVFRHADQSRNTAEISRLAEPEIADVLDQQLAKLSAPADELEDERVTGIEPAEPFWQPAAAEQWVMSKDAERLQRLDAYELISHLAWIQAAEDVAVAEDIATVDLDANPELSGTVKLYRKRYLHLAVDLTLGADAGVSGNSGLSQFLPVDRVRPAIVDSRRMRLGRTVYFDQPEFGVLATVTRPTIDEQPQGELQDPAPPSR